MIPPSKSSLEELYIEEKKSCREIAEILCYNPHTVWRYLKKFDIPVRSRTEGVNLVKDKISKASKGKHYSPETEFKKGQHLSPKTEFKKGMIPKSQKIFLNKAYFEEMYCQRKLSTIEIAKNLGVASITVQRWLKKVQIPLRTLSEAHKLLVGERNPSWRGGPLCYGPDWREQRRKALRRDGYSCVFCGTSEKENGCDVHHIIPYRFSHSNKLSNLVTLCVKCHRSLRRTPKDLLDKKIEDVSDLYWNQRLFQREVAKKLNKSKGWVGWFMVEHNIPRRHSNAFPKGHAIRRGEVELENSLY